MPWNSKLSPNLWASFVRELARHHGARGYTVRELAERFEISIATSRIWLQALKANDLVHISEWQLRGRQWTPVFAWGFCHEDAPKPETRDGKAARERRYRAERKAYQCVTTQ